MIKYYIVENHSDEMLEVITEKTLAKFGIILKDSDIKSLENGMSLEVFGWGILNSYTIEKIKKYKKFYLNEGWGYIETLN